MMHNMQHAHVPIESTGHAMIGHSEILQLWFADRNTLPSLHQCASTRVAHRAEHDVLALQLDDALLHLREALLLLTRPLLEALHVRLLALPSLLR